MIFSRAFQLISLLLLLSVLSFAQTIDNQTEAAQEQLVELKKVWLEKLTKDTADIKLPENKALLYARLGRLYWKIDKDRARELFRTSIDELIKAQKEAELDRNSVSRNDLLQSGETRRKILEIIVGYDEELGFEMFLKSRPAEAVNALAKISSMTMRTASAQMTPEMYVVLQENRLEQQIVMATISSNPSRAINLLRRDAPYNLNEYTIQLLKTLRRKDKVAADEITAEIIGQILTKELIKDTFPVYIIYRLLIESTQNKTYSETLNVDAKSAHDLAGKLADFLTLEANRNYGIADADLKTLLITCLPERSAELNEKLQSQNRSAYGVLPVNKEAAELIKSNVSPEKLLSEADKFPAGIRQEIYVNAVNQIAFNGEIDRAKEILAKNFPADKLPVMYGTLYWQLANRAINTGEFDKALSFIDQVNEGSRFGTLLQLATAIQVKKPNDNQKAKSVLGKARQMVSETPTTSRECGKIGELATAYALVEPETGFRLLEILIKKSIEISDAVAIVNNFQEQSNIRKNEFLIINGWNGIGDLRFLLPNLIKSDFERAIKTFDKIPRSEIRIPIQILILGNDFNY